MPMSYDYGAMRETWLTHALTDWMGDDAWLWKLRCQHRKFNYMGDTTWVRGKVVDKVQVDGRNEVDLEVSCGNQRGETPLRAPRRAAADPGTRGRASRRRRPTPWTSCSRPRSRASVDLAGHSYHEPWSPGGLRTDRGTGRAARGVPRPARGELPPPALVRSLAGGGQGHRRKLWQRGAELGWTGLAVPEELDGAGQGVVELCLVAEEMGRAAAPGPFLDSALIALALARAAAADLVGALAAGDVKAIVAHHGAVVGIINGDELVLRGRATAVQAAASADWLLVTVAVGQGSAPGTGAPGGGLGRAPADTG